MSHTWALCAVVQDAFGARGEERPPPGPNPRVALRTSPGRVGRRCPRAHDEVVELNRAEAQLHVDLAVRRVRQVFPNIRRLVAASRLHHLRV